MSAIFGSTGQQFDLATPVAASPTVIQETAVVTNQVATPVFSITAQNTPPNPHPPFTPFSTNASDKAPLALASLSVELPLPPPNPFPAIAIAFAHFDPHFLSPESSSPGISPATSSASSGKTSKK